MRKSSFPAARQCAECDHAEPLHEPPDAPAGRFCNACDECCEFEPKEDLGIVVRTLRGHERMGPVMIGDQLRLVSGRWDRDVLACASCGSEEMQMSLFGDNEILVLCSHCYDTVATSAAFDA